MDYLIRKVSYKNLDITKIIFNTSTFIGFAIIGTFIFYCFYNGIFKSAESFSSYILHLGIIAPIIFILIQTVQVIIPILPGSIGCVAGVIAFGSANGFLYNYIGICLGSVIAFLISKKYGSNFVKKIVNTRTINKYCHYINSGKKFDKFFAIAILAPVAPDDLLCFLAGLTKMTLKKFTLIIF